jgi:TRAP-type mannitol/chloroaromatic compound transport system permease small subunit
MTSALERTGRALIAIGARLGRASAWLILPMMAAVLAAVAGGLLRVNEVLAWGVEIPLFGDRLTLTGLAELQWHLLALLVMLGGAWALAEDRHVNVDMISARFGPRATAAVRLVGDLIFLLPLCLMIAWYAWGFTEMAWRTGERSDYGGLTDRWLAKALMPLGFGLLALVGFGRVLLSLAVLFGGRRDG